MVATGNVVYTSPQTRIAAEKLELNLDTKIGTFHNATGSTYLGDKVDKSFFGTQEPDALFYGEVVQKVGPKRYKITHGGFTSCVQPTPRWELVSSTALVELDEYAVLTNTVLKVKGVPMFYLPVMYYPIQSDDRATGFLLPTYGSSTIRGPEPQQRLLLGDQPQPRRDHLPRLVHQAWTGCRRRVPLRGRQGVAGHVQDVLPQGEGSDVLDLVRHDDDAGRHQLRGSRQRRAGAAGQPARARQRGLLLQHRHPLDLQPESLRLVVAHAQRARQPVWQLGQAEHERDLRHHRVVLLRDRVADDRWHAAAVVQPRPEPHRPDAVLLQPGLGVREPRPRSTPKTPPTPSSTRACSGSTSSPTAARAVQQVALPDVQLVGLVPPTRVTAKATSRTSTTGTCRQRCR